MSENEQAVQNALDFSEQEQIRREKLRGLMESGQNP